MTTVPKSNQIIVETEAKLSLPNTGLFPLPLTHIYMTTHVLNFPYILMGE